MELYAYLILTIPFLISLAWIFWRRSDLRRSIIRVGILGGIIGMISELWYYQDYWRPETLFGKGIPSIEDFLFGFGIVGLGASLSFYILRKTWPKVEKGRTTRLIVFIVSVIALFIILTNFLNINSMISTYILFVSVVVIGLIRWPNLWKPMIISAIGLIVIGVLSYAITWLLVSRNQTDINDIYLINDQWWAPVYFGFLPLTEVIWYGLWGMAATALPYILNNSRVKTAQQNPKDLSNPDH